MYLMGLTYAAESAPSTTMRMIASQATSTFISPSCHAQPEALVAEALVTEAQVASQQLSLGWSHD